MAAAEGDVEHEAACVVGGFRVPAGRRVPDRELNAGLFPRLGRGDRSHRDAASLEVVRQAGSPGDCPAPAKPRREPHFADREPVEQVGQAVVVVLVGVAQEDRVDAADAARPERRRDDPAADGRIAEAAAIVEQSLAVGRVEKDRQAMPDRQEFGLQGGVLAPRRRRATSRARSRPPGATRRRRGSTGQPGSACRTSGDRRRGAAAARREQGIEDQHPSPGRADDETVPPGLRNPPENDRLGQLQQPGGGPRQRAAPAGPTPPTRPAKARPATAPRR